VKAKAGLSPTVGLPSTPRLTRGEPFA
jgi:hypothetical protein